MNFRWHPETLNADGPDCGNDERFQLILKVDLTNFSFDSCLEPWRSYSVTDEAARSLTPNYV